MKKTLLMSSLMVALAAAGLNADTHDTEMDTEGEFETEMDTQDGMETEDEFDTEMDTEMDTQDGMGEVDHGQLFMELDTNADGAISRDEAEEATDYPSLAEQFDELDEDGNDELSMEEFEAWEPEEGEGMEW